MNPAITNFGLALVAAGMYGATFGLGFWLARWVIDGTVAEVKSAWSRVQLRRALR